MALASNELESSLNAAFATKNLRCICRAVDAAVLHSGRIIEIARAAECDRTTLYRAFRLGGGPKLDTMIKVLRALGFQLAVELCNETAHGTAVERRPRKNRQASATARRFTAAFKTGRRRDLLNAFAETLREQENVAAFAKRTTMSRENLYRVFSRNLNPRFDNLLSVLNALGLRFAVRSLPNKAGLRPGTKTLSV